MTNIRKVDESVINRLFWVMRTKYGSKWVMIFINAEKIEAGKVEWLAKLKSYSAQGNKIRFEPMPDKVYTIEGEYKRSTQVLALDADVPTNLPDDFHMAIVWQALTYYGFYENAPEVLEEAETKFGNLLIRLEIEQLPEFSEDYEALA